MASTLGIKNTSFALAATGVVPCGMLGGTPAFPIAATVTTAISGAPQTSGCYADFQDKYVYVQDGNGDVWQGNLATGAWVEMYPLPASTISYGMEVSPDGTYLLISLNNETVVKVLTAAPYTVSVYLGVAGSSAYTDGSGTTARIKGGGVMWYNFARTILYVLDAGTLRAITIATGAIATLNALGASTSNAIDLGASGLAYQGAYAGMSQLNILTNTSVGVATVPGYSGTNAWQWIPDNRQPSERCVYAVNNVDGKVWRYDFNVGLFTQIATLPAAASAVGGHRAARWSNNHLLVLAGSSVYKIA